MAPTRYTGRFPNRIAVGEARTEPTPKPIMYNPVVSDTLAVVTWYVDATFVNPAARIGVIPPPTMQYKPSDMRAESLLHIGQLRGSLCESSGCGSRIIAPSFVNFFPLDALDWRDSRWLCTGVGGCEGREEAEVRAGALRRPRGSFRSPVRRRTDPAISKVRFRRFTGPVEALTWHFVSSWVIQNTHTPSRRFCLLFLLGVLNACVSILSVGYIGSRIAAKEGPLGRLSF